MTSPESDKMVSELLAKCEAAIKTRNFEEAITGCRAVLQVAPDHPRAKELLDDAQSKLEAELFVRDNLRKAQESFDARDFQKCINECQKIGLLDPDNADAAALLKSAQEKLEAEPFIANFISSGQSLFDSGLYDEAVSQWEKVRSIDPKYPGLDQMIKGAREKLSPGSSGGSSMFDLNLDLGQSEGVDGFSFDQIQLQDEGQEGFGFTSDQDRIRLLLREGDELSAKGQFQKAIEVWSEIFMLDVNHPEALQKIEIARDAANQQRQQSQDIIKKAVDAFESGSIQEARELFLQVREIDPDNPEASRYLGMLDTAQEGPISLEDLLERAKASEEKQSFREAAQYYAQALAIDADNADIADKVKNLNLLAKKQEHGRTVLGNARAFIAEGKIESARHAVTKILESDPSNPEALEVMREIKQMLQAQAGAPARTASTGATGTARQTMAAKKSFPLVPVAIVGAVILLGGGGFALFSLLKDKPAAQTSSSNPAINKPVQKPNKENSQQQSAAPTQPAVLVTPESKEKAAKLVLEASFYFQEKDYPEALKKADEALENDPENLEAKGLKMEAAKIIKEAQIAERKLLEDANAYFGYSEFAGAVKLYEQYLQKHPESVEQIQPQIIKCYYNLGVIAIRQWRCDTAADYFRQVLFIDDTDRLSKDALSVSRRCQQVGTTDLEVRKSVAFMEMRK